MEVATSIGKRAANTNMVEIRMSQTRRPRRSISGSGHTCRSREGERKQDMMSANKRREKGQVI
eukprot:9392073-Alexandrium_andersonii.AAC.1